jgi:hypothetical protein
MAIERSHMFDEIFRDDMFPGRILLRKSAECLETVLLRRWYGKWTRAGIS